MLGLKSGLPVRFALMPGGVTDGSIAADLLWEAVGEDEALRGKERFGAVLEAKHFDMPNLARAGRSSPPPVNPRSLRPRR